MTTPSVRVTYTGREDPFIERNYGSALSFEPGQSRTLPAELADKLLRHADVFEMATGAPEQEPEKKGEADTTAAQLEEAAKNQDEQSALTNQRQDVVDQINLMDKDALKTYAQNNYGQAIAKTMSVENMRGKVVGMIDQFGLV